MNEQVAGLQHRLIKAFLWSELARQPSLEAQEQQAELLKDMLSWYATNCQSTVWLLLMVVCGCTLRCLVCCPRSAVNSSLCLGRDIDADIPD